MNVKNTILNSIGTMWDYDDVIDFCNHLQKAQKKNNDAVKILIRRLKIKKLKKIEMEKIRKQKELFKWYMKGFNNELKGTSSIVSNGQELRAYQIGASDALIGDEVSSNDERSYDDIIKELINEK